MARGMALILSVMVLFGCDIFDALNGTFPDAPTDLRATAGDGQVTLRWRAPGNTGTKNGAKAEIMHYNVYMSTSSGRLKSGDIRKVESGTSATYGGLVNGTTFYFAVSAVNSVGESNLSDEVSAMLTANVQGDRVPDAPTNLLAVSGNGRAGLIWRAPGDTGIKDGAAAAITQYVVYWSNFPGNIETSGNSKAVTSGTSTVVEGLVNGTLYYFAATAFNAAGRSALSNVTTVTPEAGSSALGVPTGLRTAGTGEGSISLTWDAVSGADEYEIRRDGSILNQRIFGNRFTDTGLESGREYKYSVRAKRAAETSGWSLPIPGITNLSPPPPPANLRVAGTTTADSISLSWDAVPGATWYELQRNGSRVYGGGETSFTDNSGLSSGTSYSYRVRAKNSAGFGDLSNALSESTASPPDLVLENTRVDKTSVSPGDTIRIFTTVRNTGGSRSDFTKVKYYRSANSSISSSDTYEDYDNVNRLSPNSTDDEYEDIAAPLTSGTYYYGAIVESVPGESNTFNNKSPGIRVEVIGKSDLKPDLTVSISIPTTSYKSGDRIKLSATIQNIGNEASGETEVRYYRSDNSTITPFDTYLGYISVSSISAGGSTSEYVYVDAPSTPSTYYYGAIVDSVSGEADESNNTDYYHKPLRVCKITIKNTNFVYEQYVTVDNTGQKIEKTIAPLRSETWVYSWWSTHYSKTIEIYKYKMIWGSKKEISKEFFIAGGDSMGIDVW